MYTVSIVEDEHLINEKIKTILLKISDKIKIVGQYSNGLDALNAYEQNGYPDIIISDICMPNVSGIELARTIKNKSGRTQLIIISGYADFEFAKQAAEIKVSQYLLKPIKINELLFSIEKCIDFIEEYDSRAEAAENRQLYELEKYIFGKADGAQHIIPAKQKTQMKYDYYALVGIHSCEEDPLEFAGILLDAEKAAADLSLSDGFFPFYEAGGSKHCYVVLGGNDMEALKADCRSFCKAVCAESKAKIKLCYTISKRDAITGLKERNDLVFLKRFICDDDVFPDEQPVINQTELRNSITGSYKTFANIIKNISQQNDVGIQSDLADLSESIFSVDNIKRCGYAGLKTLFIEFFLNLNAVFNHYLKERTKIIDSVILSGEVLNDFDDNTQLNNFIQNIISSGISKKDGEAQKSGLVEKAIRLVYDNYANPDFSLSVAARELYVNPSYLSRVFKETTGYNFSRFTNQVKIEKAKQLLLSTDRDIVDIAFEVGYNNQQYFAKIFKSFTNLSPYGYRQKELNKPGTSLTSG